MGSVIVEMSMSLDGYIAGPNDQRLHQWMLATGGPAPACREPAGKSSTSCAAKPAP